MLPLAWKYHISTAVCAMKNHLRCTTNLKGMLIKLILINHHHCPICSITVKQKSNFLSHIANHNYKNENITSKEGETPAESLFTDKDINEEKCYLNLSPLQTTKKNATFKMSEKVNCSHCGIELRKDSLRRHTKKNT